MDNQEVKMQFKNKLSFEDKLLLFGTFALTVTAVTSLYRIRTNHVQMKKAFELLNNAVDKAETLKQLEAVGDLATALDPAA
jgi:hypothetical protein